MTTNSDNKINNKDNKWIQWIEDGIANEYINYHDYYNEFQNIERIGDGGFGEVYRANWEGSNTVVALKSLKSDDCCMKEIVNEITMMHRVNFHTNIIQFYGVTKRKKSTDNVDSDYLFVLEYADSGTLRDYLKNNFNELDWNDKLQFAIQIADAVSCIHRKNIVHRDLHSKNILVQKNIIKLADFGLSRRAEVSNSTKNILGVLPYIDPHYLKKNTNYNDDKNHPSKKSDVYSVGVLLWEISSGRNPFGSHDAPLLLLDIISGKRETPISGTPVDYVNIYKRCWQDNPDDRPDMHQVFSELKSINLQKTWNDPTAINNSSNSSSLSYSSTSISYSSNSSLYNNSLDRLLEIEDEKSTTTTSTTSTDIQSRSNKNRLLEIEDEKSTTTTSTTSTDGQSRSNKKMLLRSFLKDHKNM